MKNCACRITSIGHRQVLKISIFIIAAMMVFPFSLSAQGSLDVGLVGYFPFNGDATDESGSGNDGTVSGATLTTDRNGNSNSAFRFDGIDDYISIADAIELRGGGSHPVSVAAWFKANLVDGLKPIVTKYLDIDKKDWGIRVKDSTITFSSENSSDDYTCVDSLQGLVDTSDWYFVVFVADEPNINIYLNGEQVTYCGNFINHWSGTPALVEIGRIGYNDTYFSGIIDDVRIYNRVLNPDEINLLYTGPTSVESADPDPPRSYEMAQNYPNPFNPTTQISFELPVKSPVSITIYNTAGQRIRELVSSPFEPGSHSVIWNGMDDQGKVVSSGIYLYTINASGYMATRKMVKLK